MKRLSSNLHVEPVNGNEMILCRCGAVLGPAAADHDPKELLKAKDADLSAAGPKVNPYGLGGRRFFLREYFCPACYRLIETEVVFKQS